GTPAPSPIPGSVFRYILAYPFAFNDAGEVAFTGIAYSGSPEYLVTGGLWTDDGASLVLRVQMDTQAADMPAGILLDSIDSLVLDADGTIMYGGTLSGPGIDETNDSAIWTLRGQSSTLLMRTGDNAPGFPPDTTIASLGGFSMNRGGLLAIFANVADRDAPADLLPCVLAGHARKDLHAVVSAGDPIHVAPGDVREIASLWWSGQTGAFFDRSSILNDLDQFAFEVSFTDGSSGILVANIPELRHNRH